MATKKQATAGVVPKKTRTTSVRRKQPEQLVLSGLGEHSKKGLAAAGAWPTGPSRNARCSTKPVPDLPGFKPEKPVFDPTKPVETRDGRKARIICTDAVQPLGSIVALVTMHDGTEEPMVYHADGTYIQLVSKDDLVNSPQRDVVPGAVRFIDSNGTARKFYVSVHLTNNQLVSIEPYRAAT